MSDRSMVPGMLASSVCKSDKGVRSFNGPKLLTPFLLMAIAMLAGCVSPAQHAHWVARKMGAKMAGGASGRAELRLRQKLISLTPASDRYLEAAYFPIGIYDIPPEAIPTVAAAGFNLIVNSDTTGSYLRLASAAGMRVIPYIRQDDMRRDVADAATKDIFAWYLMDEPDLNQMPAGEYKTLARKLRDEDSDRPIFLTVWSRNRYFDYADECDIFAPTLYPVFKMDAAQNDLTSIAQGMRVARAAAAGKPVWPVLQAFWAEPAWERNPNPDELRCMTYLAFNNGASGVIYFSWKSGGKTLPEHEELWAEIKETVGELRSLRAALLVPPARGSVQFRMVEDDPPLSANMGRIPFRYEPLDISLRSFMGAQLLTIVNPHPWPKRATITLPDSLRNCTAQELFARGRSPLNFPCASPVELPFDPFGVRLFWIASADDSTPQ